MLPQQVVLLLIDNRQESKVRPFLVTEAYDFEESERLTPLIDTQGLWLVYMCRAVNARRKHAVGHGKGKRLMIQQRMQFKKARKIHPSHKKLSKKLQKVFGRTICK